MIKGFLSFGQNICQYSSSAEMTKISQARTVTFLIVNRTLTLIGALSGGFVSSTTWATSAGLIFPHFRRRLAALSISLGPFLFPEKCCRIRICKPLPRKLQAK